MRADSAAPTGRADLVLSVLRGDSPPAAVAAAGYHLSREGATRHLVHPSRVGVGARARYGATVADVARGLVAHLRDPEALTAWAFLVLALADRRYADEPDGLALRDAVVRACFRVPSADGAVECAQRLAAAESA